MSVVRRLDHIGITVADLDAVTEFFVGLGLEVEGRTSVEGEFLDTVIGIPESRTGVAFWVTTSVRMPQRASDVHLQTLPRTCVLEPVAQRGHEPFGSQPGRHGHVGDACAISGWGRRW